MNCVATLITIYWPNMKIVVVFHLRCSYQRTSLNINKENQNQQNRKLYLVV